MRLIVFLSLCCLFSCIKEKSGGSVTFLKNLTGHNITILPYSGNKSNSKNQINILPYEKKEVQNVKGKGKSLGSSFASSLQLYDSILVQFNDEFKTTHLDFKYMSDSVIDKLEFTNSRNITNESNYKILIKKNTKDYIFAEVLYEFTNQDYEFAKSLKK